ncbi:MAG: hypothetical protein P4L46_06560 [Fimbriimonas sp.]|nr:hypothetical protein [Fimbriimonas sp.]
MRHEKSPLGRSFRTEMAKRANHSYAPNVSGSNLRDRVTSLPLTPSNPPEVETVVLAFESIDRGEQAVRGVLSRFKSQGAVAASDRLSDKEGHTFVVDVPEGEVSHTIDQLKRLPFREPVARDLADVGLSVGKPIDGGPTEASTAAGTIAGGIGGAGGGKSGRVDGQRGGGGGFAGGLGGGAAGAAPGGRSIGGGQFGAASAGPSNRFAREAAGGFSQKKLAGNAPRQDASDFKVQRRINSGTSVNATVSPVVNEKSSIHAGMQLKLNTAPVRPVLQGSTAKPVVMRRIVIVVTVKKK